MNYRQLNNKLQSRCFNSRKLANNTYAIRHEDYLSIKLHNTEILKYYKNGDIIIDADGWHTVTTKSRLNDYLDNAFIFQSKSRWYISMNEKTYYFKDGLKINGDNINAEEYNKEEERRLNKLNKSIDKYIDKFIDVAISGKLQKPSIGDCLYCQLEDKNGNPVKNLNHILSHIEENYFVPSLFWNAMQEHQNSFSIVDRHNLALILEQNTDFMMIDMTKQRIKKALKNFINKQLSK